jgi:hypothetical protein
MLIKKRLLKILKNELFVTENISWKKESEAIV